MVYTTAIPPGTWDCPGIAVRETLHQRCSLQPWHWDPCFHQIVDLSHILKPLAESPMKSLLHADTIKGAIGKEHPNKEENKSCCHGAHHHFGIKSYECIHASPHKQTLEFYPRAAFTNWKAPRRSTKEIAWQVAWTDEAGPGSAMLSLILFLSIRQSPPYHPDFLREFYTPYLPLHLQFTSQWLQLVFQMLFTLKCSKPPVSSKFVDKRFFRHFFELQSDTAHFKV